MLVRRGGCLVIYVLTRVALLMSCFEYIYVLSRAVVSRAVFLFLSPCNFKINTPHYKKLTFEYIVNLEKCSFYLWGNSVILFSFPILQGEEIGVRAG